MLLGKDRTTEDLALPLVFCASLPGAQTSGHAGLTHAKGLGQVELGSLGTCGTRLGCASVAPAVVSWG